MLWAELPEAEGEIEGLQFVHWTRLASSLQSQPRRIASSITSQWPELWLRCLWLSDWRLEASVQGAVVGGE